MKREWLIITILAIVLSLPALSSGTPFRCDLTTFSTLSEAGNIGYSMGKGGGFDFKVKGKWIGFRGYGSYRDQAKIDAQSGHTYNQGFEAIAYLGSLYFSLGYRKSGYRSVFSSGEVWQKACNQESVGIGFESKLIESTLTYFFREDETINRSSSLLFTVIFRSRINNRLSLYLPFQFGVIDFEQGHDKRVGYTKAIGIGVSYKFNF